MNVKCENAMVVTHPAWGTAQQPFLCYCLKPIIQGTSCEQTCETKTTSMFISSKSWCTNMIWYESAVKSIYDPWAFERLFCSGCLYSGDILPSFWPPHLLASRARHRDANCNPPTDQVRAVLSLLVLSAKPAFGFKSGVILLQTCTRKYVDPTKGWGSNTEALMLVWLFSPII